MDQNGDPIQVLTLNLASEIEYRLYNSHASPEQELEVWLVLGVLRLCKSAWNTQLLPMKKSKSDDYHPVQHLLEVNCRVMDIHPMVPNSYTLLSSLPPDWRLYSVLVLKDVFFSLHLAPKSKKYFAFECHDPEKGINGQLTWTYLPTRIHPLFLMKLCMRTWVSTESITQT